MGGVPQRRSPPVTEVHETEPSTPNPKSLQVPPGSDRESRPRPGPHTAPPGRGNEVVYKSLQALIVKADPALDPEAMGADLPWHFDIDPARPEDAFLGGR